MSNEVSSARLPLDWLVTPAAAFNHPDEVLSHPGLTVAEKRAILASWAQTLTRSTTCRGCDSWSAEPASP